MCYSTKTDNNTLDDNSTLSETYDTEQLIKLGKI